MDIPGRRDDLTIGSVWKKLLIFFIPIAAGTCIQQLYNTVDGMIVGRFVGTSALAAVGGSSAHIINVLIGFFVSMTSGAAVVIAQIYGAGRIEDVRRASGNAIAVSILLGLLLGVAGYLSSPALLRLMKTPEETIELAILYLRIYFAGVPFILVLNMESNIMRSLGDSLNPFIFMVAGCIANIVLDFVFVLGFGWGVAGVATATVAAQIVNLALLTFRLMHSDSPCKLALKELSIGGKHLKGMIRMGVPAGLQSAMYSLSNMLIQVAVNTLGTVVVASWAMTSKTDGIYWAVSSALGTAITSFIGQNFGAGKMDRVKKCVIQGLMLSLGITVFLSILIMALAMPLLNILTKDADVIDTTYYLMWMFVPFYFTWSFIEVFSAVLRGAGDATRPVIIIGLGICLFRVIWIFSVFAYFRTLEILCMSYLTSWVVTDIALFVYYRRGGWLERSKNRFGE